MVEKVKGKRNRRLLMLLSLGLITVLIFSFLASENPNWFTEDEHINRVSERIEKKFNDGYFDSIIDEPLIGFSVYPLHTEDDELKFMLVEFEPIGFVYVLIKSKLIIPIMSCSGSQSMYGLGYEKNSDVSKSPYSFAGVENEKKYFLRVKQAGNYDYIPAVKRGDKYLNLISMEEFEYQKILAEKEQAVINVNFIPSHMYDL